MMYFRYANPIQKPVNVCGLLCLIFIVRIAGTSAHSLSTHPVILPHCSAPTLQESFFQESVADFCKSCTQECPSKHHHVAPELPLSTRVAELNETTLEKALDLVHSSNGTYIAVLYYATWCPFSRQVRPVYDVLSTMFPTVHHVAVEESSVRPSVLSQYGVHSFPILFMHNRTARVRYYGSRDLEYLIRFYRNYTGLSATEGNPRKEDCAFARLVYDAGTDAKEGCPYPWAISPEKWLQDDMYLNLAVVFLVLRFVYIVIPTLVMRLKVRWEKGNFTSVPLRANHHPLASHEDGALLGNEIQVGNETDDQQLGAGPAHGLNSNKVALLNWPPAHTYSEIAESSSSRAGPSGEVQDMGGME